MDRDGDLDVLISDTGHGHDPLPLAYIRNDGSPAHPMWRLVTEDFPVLSNPHDRYAYIFPVFADIDADGWDEVIMGAKESGIYLFENVTDQAITEIVEYVTEPPC